MNKYKEYKNIDRENLEIFIKKNQKDSNDEILLDVKDIKKNFGSKEVLKGLNFQITKNKNMAFLGANGAGKSVFLEIASGLMKPSSGKIDYNFSTTNINKQIGVQYQSIDFPPSLTVKDMIDFQIELFKIKISNDELDDIMNSFQICNLLKTKGSKLSGGQKQRLNVLLSILQKPKIVFLDEFSTGLDFSIKSKIEDFIYKFAKENEITIVVVSHDVSEIEFFADEIVIIENGKVILFASIDDVKEKFGSIRDMMKIYIR